MIVDDLVRAPGSWLSMKKDTGVVVSSRIRLARNLADIPFPSRAGAAEKKRVRDMIFEAFDAMPGVESALHLNVASLSPVDRLVLTERHLASAEIVQDEAGSIIIAEGEQVALMVNEEDHVRLQAMSPGMSLLDVWRRADAIDTALESCLNFAFDPQLGYLTACPSNVGTGLRASVMLHLPGLGLMNEIDPVLNGLEKLGLMVRGLFGEGTEAQGNMFQVSNQATLGWSEEEIIQDLLVIVDEVCRHEENARARLLESRETFLVDQILRSYGLLKHARLIPSREALDLLSLVRLGVDLGVVRQMSVRRLNEIVLLTQPGHLQTMAGKQLDFEERDELRASMIRERFRNVSAKVV